MLVCRISQVAFFFFSNVHGYLAMTVSQHGRRRGERRGGGQRQVDRASLVHKMNSSTVKATQHGESLSRKTYLKRSLWPLGFGFFFILFYFSEISSNYIALAILELTM